MPVWTWTGSSLEFCSSRKDLCIPSFFFRWKWGCYIQLSFCPPSKSCWEALLKDANIHQSHSHCIMLIFISGFEEGKQWTVRAQQLWGTSRSPCHPEQLKNPKNSLFFQEKAAAFLAHWGSFHYHKVCLLCHPNVTMCAPFWLSVGWCRWDLLLVTGISWYFGQGWGLESTACSVVSLKLATCTFACSHCLQCRMPLSKWKIAVMLLGGGNLPCLLLSLVRC